ncbi:MAG: YfiR family protein [Desulfosarcinaceae bacterium]|nr:YfiR family protein [Desulfosarcinaceae bacterium]
MNRRDIHRSAIKRIQRLLLALSISALLLLPAPSAAWAEASPRQADVIKVAMIFNFAKFTEWPAAAFMDDAGPFRIGIIGRDPFGAAWDAIASKQIRGRSLQIDRSVDLGDAAGFHILYVGQLETIALADLVGTISDTPVLTISDLPGFTKGGGIVQFVTQDNKIRFQINHNTSLRQGLKLSSHLLKLARIVDDR